MKTTHFGTSHMQLVGPCLQSKFSGRIPKPDRHRQDRNQAPLKDVRLDRLNEDQKRIKASNSGAVATTSEACIESKEIFVFEIVSEVLGNVELYLIYMEDCWKI